MTFCANVTQEDFIRSLVFISAEPLIHEDGELKMKFKVMTKKGHKQQVLVTCSHPGMFLYQKLAHFRNHFLPIFDMAVLDCQKQLALLFCKVPFLPKMEPKLILGIDLEENSEKSIQMMSLK